MGAVFGRNAAIEVVNEGYPKQLTSLFLRSSQGAFVEDYGGNKYIDTSLGVGTHIFGHGFIDEVIGNRLKSGTLFAAPSALPYDVAGAMHAILPHLDRYIFCNSGAEATMRATRIARAFSRKPKIALFGGGWHGGSDVLLFEENPASPHDQPQAMFKSAGIPDELLDSVILLPYNSPAAFGIIKAHAHELALVIIEPSQGSNPRADVAGFLTELREVTERNGVLLCFDEIITGFRIAAGGCQEFYGIEADLATYGKIIGGGLPVGVVASRAGILDEVTVRAQDAQKVFLGGTFSANPLVMHVAKAVLDRLSECRETIYPDLNRRGQDLRDRVSHYCIDHAIPVRMMGIGSMNRVLFTDREVKSRRDRDHYELGKQVQDVFYKYLLLEHGIFVNKNRVMFLSTLHDDAIVETLASAINASLEFFQTNDLMQ
ncbi:MAG: aminotransferase class III-fold pyridoxal phosphate-dependent enzyme [Betaproteobacteria bacterium]|nr:aminotransferase class III-fold pyridoxal phosphate-dependent enzyme [Betaproteobacteria bacterium]